MICVWRMKTEAWNLSQSATLVEYEVSTIRPVCCENIESGHRHFTEAIEWFAFGV